MFLDTLFTILIFILSLDISLSAPFDLHPYEVDLIFQDTGVPIYFNVSVGFSGSKISLDSSGNTLIDFEMYLSDQVYTTLELSVFLLFGLNKHGQNNTKYFKIKKNTGLLKIQA